MGSVSTLERERRKRDRARFIRRLFVVVSFALVMTVAVFISQGGALRVAGGNILDAFMSFFAGDSMPVNLPIERPEWSSPVAGRIAVADNSTLSVYTKSGRLVGSNSLGFQQPAFISKSARILSYDLGGSRFSLFFWGDHILSQDTGASIYCADLSPKGRIAIGGAAPNALSGVKVYDEDGSELFGWTSTEQMVSSVALAYDGTQVAFTGISTEKGEVYSSLNLYKIDKEEPQLRTTLPGEMVVNLEIGYSGIYAFSDKGISLIDSKGERKAVYNYGAAPVAFAVSDDGLIGIITGDLRDSDALTVTLLSGSLKELDSWSIAGEVQQISFFGSLLYIVSDEQYITFEESKEPSFTRIPEGIMAVPGDELYYISSTQIKKSVSSN